MIICISGPSSTGKTTLFNELCNYSKIISSLRNSGVVIFKEESIRQIINSYKKSFEEITSNPDTAIDFQVDVANQIYSSYEEMLSYPDILYICDRSPPDNVVYNLMNYTSGDDLEVMARHRKQLSHVCSVMRSLYSYVDRVYLTQVDRSNDLVAEDDGFRLSVHNDKRQLEIELFNTIFDFSDKVVKLPSNLDDRVNTILTDFSVILRR